MDQLASQIKENSLIAEEILFDVLCLVQPGVSTFELNDAAARGFRRRGVLPAALFLGAGSAISISINREVLFGEISKDKRVEDGDIVKLDLGVYHKGVFSDLGLSVGVGRVSPESAKLLTGTWRALAAALNVLCHSVPVSRISAALENTLREHAVTPIAEMCGHGIGRSPHEKPFIPAVTALPFIDYNCRLERGMVVCIEPFGTSGSGATVSPDRIRITTTDSAPVAYCEVPVLVTDNGPEVLAKDAFKFMEAVREEVSPAN